jgi:hypothetical protein
MRASVPIIVSGGAGRRVMANLCNKAEEEIKAGNFAGAKRDVDTILHFARVLKQRAWLQATCPDPAFRNGQQAVKDAKAACSILQWRAEYHRYTCRSLCGDG